MFQFLSMNFFLGFPQFLLGFSKVPVFLCHPVYPTRCNVTQFIYSYKLLYMFRVVSPPIIRSTHNCIYSICYWSDRKLLPAAIVEELQFQLPHESSR